MSTLISLKTKKKKKMVKFRAVKIYIEHIQNFLHFSRLFVCFFVCLCGWMVGRLVGQLAAYMVGYFDELGVVGVTTKVLAKFTLIIIVCLLDGLFLFLEGVGGGACWPGNEVLARFTLIIIVCLVHG